MSCNNCSSKGIQDNIQTDLNDYEYNRNSPYDWMKSFPTEIGKSYLIEVSFKNNRKEIYKNIHQINLKRGDYVAVQCESGHGVGIVSLSGNLAALQLNRKDVQLKADKIVYRKASKIDMEKLIQARLREKTVMIKARQLANSLGLQMKISDVEFQGDGNKATFSYIADERVDFRELIKRFASEFNVRIEMRQIGARQEAALIGGYGSCGRELCCSSWRNKLDTVSTQAARIQELPQNAEKLTGQCGKLKCCLMYELDQYIEAHKDFPDVLLELETEKGIAYPQKKDLLKKIIYYSIGSKDSPDLVAISLLRVKEIIQLNKKGIKVPILIEKEHSVQLFTNANNEKRMEEISSGKAGKKKKHHSQNKKDNKAV